MRVAALMETFPAWSETYILWHISELVRAGVSVTILPSTRGRSELVQPEVRELDLLSRMHAPAHSAATAHGVTRLIARALLLHPASSCRLAFETARSTDRSGWTLGLAHLSLPRSVPRNFDVLHAYFGPSGRRAALLRACGALRGRLVTSFLGFDATVLGQRLGGRYYADLFARSDRIGVSSEFMRRKLLALGAPAERLIKLPLGLPVTRFPFRTRTFDGQRLRLITVGRLSEVKGIEYAVRGVALAAQRGLPVDLQIIGDGPLKRELLRLRDDLRAGEAVHFRGALDAEAVRVELSCSDAALYTGVRTADGAEEALGGAVLEAQAMGLPVIATDVGGVAEGLVPERSGLVIPQRSPDAVAEAIAALLQRAEDWPEMGRTGRAHIEQHFDSARLHERWVALYQEMVR